MSTTRGAIGRVRNRAAQPTTPDRVTEAATFTERFDYRRLDRLDPQSAWRALLEPAQQLDVGCTAEAAQLALSSAGGSPHLVQYSGDETWTGVSPSRGDFLTADHAAAAIAEVNYSLHNGMFRAGGSRPVTA